MYHSNQQEEPTYPRLMHHHWWIYMYSNAIRAGDNRRGHGGLRWMKHERPTWKITVRLTRLIRCSWDRIWLTGHGGGGMHPPGMQKQLPWVWHIHCTFSVPKVLWIQNGRSLLYQDQGFGRGCLFRWYSTHLQTYSVQGMKRCARIFRQIRRSMEQVTFILSNVTIISREFPICYMLIKNHKEERRPGSALEIWCYWSNIWIAWRGCMWHLVRCVAKKTWSVRYTRSMFVLRVERVCLVCPVALISMMI